MTRLYAQIARADTPTLLLAVTAFVKHAENRNPGEKGWDKTCVAYFTVFALNRYVFGVPDYVPGPLTIKNWNGNGAPYPWKATKSGLSFRGESFGTLSLSNNEVEEFREFARTSKRRQLPRDDKRPSVHQFSPPHLTA
jgi:hypothetical protein